MVSKVVSHQDFNNNSKWQDTPAKGCGLDCSFNFHSKPAGAPQGPLPAPSSKPNIPYHPTIHYNGAYNFTQCQTFKALCIKYQITFVHTKGLCLNCFKPGHFGRDCHRQFFSTIDNCGQIHSYTHTNGDAPSELNSAEVTSTPLSGSVEVKSNHVKACNELSGIRNPVFSTTTTGIQHTIL